MSETNNNTEEYEIIENQNTIQNILDISKNQSITIKNNSITINALLTRLLSSKYVLILLEMNYSQNWL